MVELSIAIILSSELPEFRLRNRHVWHHRITRSDRSGIVAHDPCAEERWGVPLLDRKGMTAASHSKPESLNTSARRPWDLFFNGSFPASFLLQITIVYQVYGGGIKTHDH